MVRECGLPKVWPSGRYVTDYNVRFTVAYPICSIYSTSVSATRDDGERLSIDIQMVALIHLLQSRKRRFLFIALKSEGCGVKLKPATSPIG